jgi:hypothetical protein
MDYWNEKAYTPSSYLNDGCLIAITTHVEGMCYWKKLSYNLQLPRNYV